MQTQKKRAKSTIYIYSLWHKYMRKKLSWEKIFIIKTTLSVKGTLNRKHAYMYIIILHAWSDSIYTWHVLCI